MCIDPATLALVSTIGSASLGALSAFDQYKQGKAREAQAEENAKSANVESSKQIEERVRNDRYRQGAEISSIANSGVSGSYGSPFLVALENAETTQANLEASSVAGFNRSQAIRTQGANAAAAGRSALFGGIAGAAVTGFQGYQKYKKNRANALYIGGSTVPGAS